MDTAHDLLVRGPELGMFGQPNWCHHHCTKMRLNKEETDLENKKIIIEGSAAKLTITFHEELKRWLVSWEVIQSQNEGAKGKMFFTDDMLKAAFGLQDHLEKLGSEWLTQRYGGTIACQHRFIRWQKYLNIPCPGTGHDGDPNISIQIDQEIMDAVAALL
ncbi:hypothetical protein ACFL2U_03860 [Patescibacteria group bacterium]